MRRCLEPYPYPWTDGRPTERCDLQRGHLGNHHLPDCRAVAGGARCDLKAGHTTWHHSLDGHAIWPGRR